MKTDNEIWNLYENKEYEALSTAELQRLKALIELKQFEKEVKVDIPSEPDIAKQESSPNNYGFDDWSNSKDRKIVLKNMGIIGNELADTEMDGYFNFASSDSGCDESSQLDNNWKPSMFARDIIQSALVTSPLWQICRAGYDWDSGKGDIVNIRVISTAPDMTEGVSSCTCLSCCSNTFDKYSITIQQIGSYHVECSWDAFKVGGGYRQAVIESISRRWQEYFASEIADILSGTSWGYSETLNNILACSGAVSGSCCTNGSDLMACILNAQATLLEAGYNADYVVMSPSIANYLLYKEQPSSPAWFEKAVSMCDGGYVARIGNLNVVVSGHLPACSSATATDFAYVLDSSRAIGYAFGKKPTFEFERDAECNSWKIVTWAYFGISALDTNACVQIVSPNS